MSQSKRILVLSNMYPGPKQATFGIFVKNQVEALRSRGHIVDVVAVDNPSMGKKQVLLKYSKWMWQTFRTLAAKGRTYDVVHAHYVFPTGMLALLFKKVFKTRMVVTAHGGDIERMAKKNERIRNWTKKILHEADEVIAVGQDLQQAIISDFGIPKENVSLLNMGVNRTIFQPQSKKEARESLGIASGVRPLVFIGNLIPEKGIWELLSAYEQVQKKDPAVKLYLVGNPKKPSFLETIHTLIDEKKLAVEIKEAVPQQEVAVWMAAAEVFVLPSHLEGFGLVALEAMACGTPVVGTNVGGLRYLLAEDHGRLVEAKDSTSLADGLHEVLVDAKLRQTLTENGFERVEQYDQERIIDKLLELYGNVEEER